MIKQDIDIVKVFEKAVEVNKRLREQNIKIYYGVSIGEHAGVFAYLVDSVLMRNINYAINLDDDIDEIIAIARDLETPKFSSFNKNRKYFLEDLQNAKRNFDVYQIDQKEKIDIKYIVINSDNEVLIYDTNDKEYIEIELIVKVRTNDDS